MKQVVSDIVRYKWSVSTEKGMTAEKFVSKFLYKELSGEEAVEALEKAVRSFVDRLNQKYHMDPKFIVKSEAFNLAIEAERPGSGTDHVVDIWYAPVSGTITPAYFESETFIGNTDILLEGGEE